MLDKTELVLVGDGLSLPDADAERGYIALGRYAKAEEIAATVAHLAGDNGRYISGESIAVDGGFAA